MHIRELSKLTGVSLRSLRYYEQKHLLSPARSENGYRIYEYIDVQRVQLIQLFLKLGVSTDEIARLIQNCEGLPGRNSNNSNNSNHQAECAAAFYEERLQEIIITRSRAATRKTSYSLEATYNRQLIL